MEEQSEAEMVCRQAYAALGAYLMDLAEKGHPQAEKLADNLCQARMVHSDVLPFADAAREEALRLAGAAGLDPDPDVAGAPEFEPSLGEGSKVQELTKPVAHGVPPSQGPSEPKCKFCGVDTDQPCELRNCMECQNFGYYPNGKPARGVDLPDGAKNG